MSWGHPERSPLREHKVVTPEESSGTQCVPAYDLNWPCPVPFRRAPPSRAQAQRRGSPALPGTVSEMKPLTQARARVVCIQPYLTGA